MRSTRSSLLSFAAIVADLVLLLEQHKQYKSDRQISLNYQSDKFKVRRIILNFRFEDVGNKRVSGLPNVIIIPRENNHVAGFGVAPMRELKL